MYFKHQVFLNELSIGFREQEPLTFATSDREGPSVTIRPLTAEEKEKHKGRFLVCIAITEEEPSSSVYEIFKRLANKPNADDARLKEQQEFVKAESQVKEPDAPSVSSFPSYFQEFASQVHHKLYESIRRTVRIIRWRWALTGPHNPIAATSGVSFSFDNQSWFVMPRDLYFQGGGFEFVFQVSARLHAEMEGLLKAGENEPLGHELFLEAWELQHRNPRSALIIGVSAAEVGLKQCIGKLAPDAEWLANNAPTPPVVKMLKEYLPFLPARSKIEGRVLEPCKRIRTAIRDGIEARNQSVHKGSKPPKGEVLKEWLLSIRDLLYLLDFYCGFEWALEYIRDEVRKEMVDEFGLKTTNPYSLREL